jgi:hypothetical protein
VGLEEKCGEERHDGVRELLEAIDVNVDEVEAKVGGGVDGSGELRQSSSCQGRRRRCAAHEKKARDHIRTKAMGGAEAELELLGLEAALRGLWQEGDGRDQD